MNAPAWGGYMSGTSHVPDRALDLPKGHLAFNNGSWVVEELVARDFEVECRLGPGQRVGEYKVVLLGVWRGWPLDGVILVGDQPATTVWWVSWRQHSTAGNTLTATWPDLL